MTNIAQTPRTSFGSLPNNLSMAQAVRDVTRLGPQATTADLEAVFTAAGKLSETEEAVVNGLMDSMVQAQVPDTVLARGEEQLQRAIAARGVDLAPQAAKSVLFMLGALTCDFALAAGVVFSGLNPLALQAALVGLGLVTIPAVAAMGAYMGAASVYGVND